MRGTTTAKLESTAKSASKESALTSLQGKLYSGEEIRWTGSPNSTWFLIDLTYKGLMWWSVFALIVPIAPGGPSMELTALLVLMLTYLEFKKQWNSRFYYITDTRAILAEKSRKGEWIFTDYSLEDLVSTKRTAIVKTLIMQFKTIHGTRTLKFPYLADATKPMNLLNRDPFAGVSIDDGRDSVKPLPSGDVEREHRSNSDSSNEY